LEYHIPTKFTPQQPAVMFSQEYHDMDIKDHPTGCYIPQPTEKPTEQPYIIADVEPFRSISNHQNTPRTISDYIGVDIPQIALHVVVFRDATAFVISFPHTFSDGIGVIQLFHAWTQKAAFHRYMELIMTL
jgi:hypothetical protein